ncbi:hypothetical protein CCACVL1_00999 [Corchorus capsularis]|uniref:Uncharacterized protein n=1 Tax=Corchorus capsularis TaxID=210143 RepID=A0A1R3KT94_COCAP|nr:hypothetical protein CCACVL1_00999 [Corchorus capsularis]
MRWAENFESTSHNKLLVSKKGVRPHLWAEIKPNNIRILRFNCPSLLSQRLKRPKKPSATPKDKQSNSTVLERNRKSHEDTLSQLVSSVQPVETAREIVDHMEKDVEEKESLSFLHQWEL